MKKTLLTTVLGMFIHFANAQSDTIYGLNFTTGNLQFSSMQISTGDVTLYGSGPITPDLFQSGVYDFDPINKRYFYPRGGQVPQLITVDAITGGIIHSPTASNATPSIVPLTNIAYNWINDTLYGTHHANESGQTVLRFAYADIATGQVTIMNTTPIATGPYIAGNSDIDPINHRYFIIDGARIRTVNTMNGQVIANELIDFPSITGSQFILNITYNWSDGLIYALYMYPNTSGNGSLLKLATLDPTNGQLTILSANPLSPDGISSGNCDIDVVGQRYFYIRQNTLYLVDITTGALITTQSIQNPNGAIVPITNMAYDDMKLPQSIPAALNLQDTIYLAPGQTLNINGFTSNNAAYQWSTGETTPQIAVNTAGTYSVQIQDDGVDIYGETLVLEGSPLGINEYNTDISVYPNPTQGELTIESSAINGSATASVFSIKGDVVLQRTVYASVNTLDVSELNPGVYYLSIQNADSLLRTSFVVGR